MGQLGDLSPAGSVVVGIFVGLVSTSVQSLGLTLQRKSHMLEDEKEFQDTRRPPYRRRRWQLGMLMFIVSNLVGSSIQITTLPLPVLSTLQASGLVFNSICATLILGEPFTRYSFAGTVLVCGGAVLIAIFGAIGEPAHNLDQLLELLERRQFMLWMVGQAVLVAAILVASKAMKLLNPYNSNSPRMRLFRGMAYGSISGVLSAHSLLVAKSAVELLVRTIVDGKNQFNRVPSWLILLGLIALALSQLYYLHRGLKLCSTSILYPFVFCVYNIIAILDGLIYFRQTSQLSLLSALLIALGTVILLTGVICLSWRLNDDPATKPSVAQNPLTPGMGFVPSDSDSDAESTLYPHSPPIASSLDEESLLLPPRSATMPTHLPNGAPPKNGAANCPFPKSKSSSASAPRYLVRKVRYAPTASPPEPSSPTSPSPLRVSHLRRPRTVAGPSHEADEIWGELEEDAPSPLISPTTARRRSFSARSRHASSSGAIGDGGASADAVEDEEPGETTGLLGRTRMGRSYRERRRRRATTTTTLTTTGIGGAQERRRASQDAVGGWWRMRRWWRDREGERERERDRRRGISDGVEDGDVV